MTITMTNDQVIDIYIDIVVNIWINKKDKDNDSDVYNDKNKKIQNKLWLMSKLCVNSIQDINSEGQWRETLDGQKFQFLLCLAPKLNLSQHHWCHQAFCISYSLILNILKKIALWVRPADFPITNCRYSKEQNDEPHHAWQIDLVGKKWELGTHLSVKFDLKAWNHSSRLFATRDCQSSVIFSSFGITKHI